MAATQMADVLAFPFAAKHYVRLVADGRGVLWHSLGQAGRHVVAAAAVAIAAEHGGRVGVVDGPYMEPHWQGLVADMNATLGSDVTMTFTSPQKLARHSGLLAGCPVVVMDGAAIAENGASATVARDVLAGAAHPLLTLGQLDQLRAHARRELIAAASGRSPDEPAGLRFHEMLH